MKKIIMLFALMCLYTINATSQEIYKEVNRIMHNAETIKKRLTVYHNQTAPLIDWYKKETLHHHINGLGELNRIFADICEVIDNL